MAKKSVRTKQESVADEELGIPKQQPQDKGFVLTGLGNFILEGPCSPCEP